MWDEPRNKHLFTGEALEKADELITLAQEHAMQMALPQGLATLQHSRSGNYSRPDNVFCTTNLLDSLIHCTTKPELRPAKVDHFPIHTTFDIAISKRTPAPLRNFRKTDWEDFNKELGASLRERPPPTKLHSVDELTNLLRFLTDALEKTIKAKVPLIKHSDFKRRWWTPELTHARNEKKKLGRKSYDKRHLPFHPIHATFKRARNDYSQMIRDQKEKHWRTFLGNLDETTIWTANRYATNEPTDGGRTRMPKLETLREDGTTQEHETNDEKAQVLYSTFFKPEPPDDALEIPANYRYPKPRFKFQHITSEQIHSQITKLAPYKAPGPNGIPNVVYKETATLVVPYLVVIFAGTFDLNHYPTDQEITWELLDKGPPPPEKTPNSTPEEVTDEAQWAKAGRGNQKETIDLSLETEEERGRTEKCSEPAQHQRPTTRSTTSRSGDDPANTIQNAQKEKLRKPAGSNAKAQQEEDDPKHLVFGIRLP